MSKQGVVKIHGKEYKTVALRVNEFREEHQSFGIDTDVVCNAELVVIKATITNPEGRVIATGYAEEMRGSTQINKTSALENCETSAIGRALACFGFAGEEYASANEVTGAIHQQEVDKAKQELIDYNASLRDLVHSVSAIKEYIHEDNLEGAAECWYELTKSEKTALWKAPSKGGIFTTQEIAIIKSDEFAALNPLRKEVA